MFYSTDYVRDLFQGFTTSQLQEVEENTIMISQREKEIQHIVKSIYDLNEIFKDLAVMIIDQVMSSQESVVISRSRIELLFIFLVYIFLLYILLTLFAL